MRATHLPRPASGRQCLQQCQTVAPTGQGSATDGADKASDDASSLNAGILTGPSKAASSPPPTSWLPSVVVSTSPY